MNELEKVVVGGIENLGADEFSILSMFMRADLVVQSVMLGLVLASIWSWSVIGEKWMLFRRLKSRAARFEAVFTSGESVQQLYADVSEHINHPLAELFVASVREWGRLSTLRDRLGDADALQRLDRMISGVIAREMAALEQRMGVLATIGAAAPFIGLFGTVWGIMNSFQAIALSQDTNLAVVAPGIAEALFATGLGLFAAIPAVIFFNRFNNELNLYAVRLELFADEFIRRAHTQLAKV